MFFYDEGTPEVNITLSIYQVWISPIVKRHVVRHSPVKQSKLLFSKWIFLQNTNWLNCNSFCWIHTSHQHKCIYLYFILLWTHQYSVQCLQPALAFWALTFSSIDQWLSMRPKTLSSPPSICAYFFEWLLENFLLSKTEQNRTSKRISLQIHDVTKNDLLLILQNNS